MRRVGVFVCLLVGLAVWVAVESGGGGGGVFGVVL